MENTSTNKSERLAGVILISLLYSILAVSFIWFYLRKTHTPTPLPIESAMYVTDWNITKIYGPGTPQQATIVEKFQSTGKQLTFITPVLYRMGATHSDSAEGILMIGFDPTHPETAHQLKAAP
ncbi:MAG: hypothetical protein ACSHX6_02650 [Akkermansiaceae bacterium]